MTPKEVIRKILDEVLTDESRWTQYHLARDKPFSKGVIVSPEHPNAACWCLSGAIMRVCGDDEKTEVMVYETLTGPNQNFFMDSIVAWNDRPYRKFPEVRKKLEQIYQQL